MAFLPGVPDDAAASDISSQLSFSLTLSSADSAEVDPNFLLQHSQSSISWLSEASLESDDEGPTTPTNRLAGLAWFETGRFQSRVTPLSADWSRAASEDSSSADPSEVPKGTSSNFWSVTPLAPPAENAGHQERARTRTASKRAGFWAWLRGGEH